MENQFFKCGCRITDIDKSNLSVNIRFDKCAKHRKELKKVSWEAWAKVHAPAEFSKYQKWSRV